MIYFLDTEFDERCQDGKANIQLISLGVVSLAGKQLYMENKAYDWGDLGIKEWLFQNVKPHLQGGCFEKNPAEIKQALLDYFGDDQNIEIWTFYGAYDWVVFCSLFGTMDKLPANMPMYSHDLMQLMKEKGIESHSLPTPPGQLHHALSDAEYNKWLYQYLCSLS